MQMLQQNQRQWKREKLLSRGVTSGSGIKWTSNASGSARPVSPVCDSSSENDGGAASRANSTLVMTGSRKGGKGSSRSSISSLTSPGRIYIDSNTVRAVQTEVENLPLPATTASICLALRTSEAVLDAHADADYSRLIDDDTSMKKFEIMGSYMDKMSLSPTQKRIKRLDDFKSACLSLVSRGNSVMLKSWEEVEVELSQVFIFGVVDIKVSSTSPQQAAASIANIPILSRGGRHQHSPKTTPKRAHCRFSPKKAQISMTPKKSLLAMKLAKSALSLQSFRDQIKKKMGPSLFRQIYQQGEIIPSKPTIASYDTAAAQLDEKIQQKESERRSSKRVDEILAAREKADKEREAQESAQESARQLMRPLTPDEQSTVNGAINGIGPVAEILASQDADSVQRGSMQTLRPRQWLNDEIINYFLKNCLAKRDENLCAKQPGRKRSHFFNSFFVQTMFDEKNHNSKLRGKYNYKNVKRWSKKVPGKDIFNLKYIVCPINLENVHWTSAVIFMEEKRIQYYDSMGGTDRTKLEGLLQYLKDEHRVKKGGEMDTTEWKLVHCTRDTPGQRNGFDCGVFTCMFCDFISKDCPLVFSQDHIDQCRERIALSIMKNCAIE
mmetsp:Transcript_23237/g.50343  ORF Transcript_23237/g.50343 Transcript_23237/m.50343 type:complete len:610 (-) Transcript_23237:9-1838(-)